jgi:hypothetical protein
VGLEGEEAQLMNQYRDDISSEFPSGSLPTVFQTFRLQSLAYTPRTRSELQTTPHHLAPDSTKTNTTGKSTLTLKHHRLDTGNLV